MRRTYSWASARAALWSTPSAQMWVTGSSGSGRARTQPSSWNTFTSTASFVVNGLTVNAANATFPDGIAGIVLGARVEVHGTVTDGVLVATKVEAEDLTRHHIKRGCPIDCHRAIPVHWPDCCSEGANRNPVTSFESDKLLKVPIAGVVRVAHLKHQIGTGTHDRAIRPSIASSKDG